MMDGTNIPPDGVAADEPREFDYQPSTRVVFGFGAIARLGQLAKEVWENGAGESGGCRVLVVSDPGIVAAGHTQRGIDSLRGAGVETFLFDGAAENPTTRHVARGVEFARETRINMIVGLGGGSSMDCAKGINFILTNGGEIADYRGIGKAKKPMLPLIAAPTTAGTGSEAQSFALIADEETHQKMACGDKKAAARVAVLDPELTLTQPRGVTAATGLDAVAHAIESFVCNAANPVSRMFAEKAWGLMRESLRQVLLRPTDRDARARMLLGAHFAGASIENSMLGAAHAAANPLTAVHNITHGIAVAVMLPPVIRFNGISRANHAYRKLLGGETIQADAAAGLASEIDGLISTAGLPARLRELNVAAETIPRMAEMAAQQWTAGFNPRPVAPADFAALYNQAW